MTKEGALKALQKGKTMAKATIPVLIDWNSIKDYMAQNDVIQVIRCKDCQYWMKNPFRESSVFGLCFKHKDSAIASDETDWCSWAERKEE